MPTIINETGEYYIDGDYYDKTILCQSNSDCFIQCSTSLQCQYVFILCNNTDYICRVSCISTYSCYFANIIAYSYDFSLLCLHGYSCYQADINLNFIHHFYNDTFSSVAVECGYEYACSLAQFTISHYENINIKCVDNPNNSVTWACHQTNFILTNIEYADIHCINYSCAESEFNIINTDVVTFNCMGIAACLDSTIFTNNTVNLLQLNCLGVASCGSVNLWCPYSNIASCSIDCGNASQSCDDMEIKVNYFEYIPYFLYINDAQNIDANNQMYVGCYNPSNDVQMHLSSLQVKNGQFVCHNIDCCPFQKQSIDILHCKHANCVISCQPNLDGTPCDIIDGSNATSLTVICHPRSQNNIREGACQGTQIICPKEMNSVCKLQCNEVSACKASAMYASAAAFIDVNCRDTYSCENMYVYAQHVEHVSISCITPYSQCFANTHVYVPSIFNHSSLYCQTPSSCDDIIFHVSDSYEYKFISVICESEKYSNCGTVQFNCHSDTNLIGEYEIGSVEATHVSEDCSNAKCCPFTHRTFSCDSKEEQCSYVCSEDNYHDCNSQYITNVNSIVCDNSRGCTKTEIFCDSGEDSACTVTCQGESTCHNITIHAQQTHNLTLHCAYNSCDNALILGMVSNNALNQNVSEINVNCDGVSSCVNATMIGNAVDNFYLYCGGDGSCNSIIVSGDMKFVSILAESEHLFYEDSVFTNGIVYAVNADKLIIECLGVNAGYACDKSLFYISKQTHITCDGIHTCLNTSIYSNTSNITQNEVNISLNFCNQCVFGEISNCKMYGSLDLYCGDKYSQFSTYDFHTCSNNNCCQDDIFSFKYYENNECFTGQWTPKINYILLLLEIIICIMCWSWLIFLCWRLKKHRKVTEKYRFYNIAFKPPEFILCFIHCADFIVHVTAVYSLLCFIISRQHLSNYCKLRYINNESYCNGDPYCATNCSASGKYCECGVGDALYLGLCIAFYVCFAVHCLSEVIQCSRARFGLGPNWYYIDSCVIRYWQLLDKRSGNTYWNYVQSDWIKQTHFNMCNRTFCSCMATVNRYIFLMAISFISLLTENYIKWYVLGSVVILLLVVQLMKQYYRNLKQYNENEEIKFILFDYFGYDIGSIVWQCLNTNKEQELHTEIELQTAKQNGIVKDSQYQNDIE